MMLAAVAATIALGYWGAANWKEIRDIPDVASLERYEPIEAIQIFDINDHLVCTVEGDEDRQVIPLNQISTQMQQAMLAAEDHHFYEHHGINFSSIGRAFLANMQAGRVVEGGSTITQQLVKNLFFEQAHRNMQRKVKEAFLSWELERRYSKDKILELYLNQVYFGNGAYGIERAAQRYFGKNATALSLAESAFIAGLVKAPSELSTLANRQQAINRQKEILNKMVEYGYITKTQAKAASEQQLIFRRNINPLQKYPYYVSYVLQLLRDRFSQAEMRKQGLRVYTNLDPIAQEAAEQVLSKAIEHAPKGVSQGALVSVSVADGSVLSLVGGVGGFWKNQWNRATNPHTAGSSFKPFVYLTGLIKGDITPSTLVDDQPITIKQGWGLPDWSPKNFDHKFMGRIPVKRALALSRNVVSVRIAQKAGIENVIETARLAGITTKLDRNLSLALGSSAVTPLEMAGAFGTFARGGIAIKPRVVRRIEDNRGRVIETFEPKIDKVFPSEPVAALVNMMQEVVKAGTGTMARLPDRPVAGKTGTADEAKDIWFIGFTPDLVTAVWGGNDENKSIPGTYVTGGTVMAKIWKDYNLAYYEKHPTPPGTFLAPSAADGSLPAPEPGDAPANEESNTATGGDASAPSQPGAPQSPSMPPPIIIPDDGTEEPPLAPPLRREPTNVLPPPAPEPMPSMTPRPPAPAAPLRPPIIPPTNTLGGGQ